MHVEVQEVVAARSVLKRSILCAGREAAMGGPDTNREPSSVPASADEERLLLAHNVELAPPATLLSASEAYNVQRPALPPPDQ